MRQHKSVATLRRSTAGIVAALALGLTSLAPAASADVLALSHPGAVGTLTSAAHSDDVVAAERNEPDVAHTDGAAVRAHDEGDGGDGADTGNTGDCPAAQASTKPEGLDDSVSLYKNLPFPMGAAISSYATSGQARDLLDRHFNQVTPENFMKPEAWYDGPWQFTTNNAEADALMTWGQQTHNRVYGHVLVWHSQIPDWFFQHDDGTFLTSQPQDQELLRQRLRTHINNVAHYLSQKYGAFGSPENPLVAFDVVNEVIADDASLASNGLRTSHWYDILGEEFIDDAFRYANEAFNTTYAAPGVEHPVTLFINEYNTENGAGPGTKTARYHDLVARLLQRGVPVDGVGHQFHLSLSTNVDNLAAALSAFDDLPVVQAVTEFDITTGTPVTEDLLRRQGAFVKRAFEIFRNQDTVKDLFSVTVWGLIDNKSWRSCDGAPLLFDNDYDGKWAYAGALGLDIPAESRNLTVFGGAPTVDVDAADDPAWAFMEPTPVGHNATMKIRWDGPRLLTRIEIRDASIDPRDAIVLTAGARHWTLTRAGDTAGLHAVVTSTDTGWTVVAELPRDSGTYAVGDLVPFNAEITNDADLSAWNDGHTPGTLHLVEPLSTTEAIATPKAPVIDGNAEAVWDQAHAVSTERQLEGQGGASATVRTMWHGDTSASTLYLLADVTDATDDVSASDPWQQDSIEIFLEPGAHKADNYNSGAMQIRVSRTNVVSFGAGDAAAQQQRLTSAVVPTDAGYRVEMAITLGNEGGAGTIHGLDAQVNDGSGGKRIAVRSWADPTGMGYQSAVRWGVVRLLPAVAPAPAPSPEPSAAPTTPETNTPAPQPSTHPARTSGSLARTGTALAPAPMAALGVLAGAMALRGRRQSATIRAHHK